MVGTRGVPARYGGFETAVEEVGRRLAAAGHDVVVHRRAAENETVAPTTHLGMRLVTLPAVRSRSLETLSHTAFASWWTVTHRRPDVVFLFNSANSPLLPALRRRGVPVAVHVDGLEWQRAKWAGAGRRYYRLAEQLAVRWADALVADAMGITDYYRHEFAASTELISYGAPILTDPASDLLGRLGLRPDGYHLVVARFEPENHVEPIVRGVVASRAELPLVVVGGAPYSDDYTAAVRAAAGDDPRIRLVGPVWDQQLLDQLYAHARLYLHGHSVGGTNPSLLRAAGAGAAVAAWDVGFNREVLGERGRWFSGPAGVAALVEAAEADPGSWHDQGRALRERVASRYRWDDVADRYGALAARLSAGWSRRGEATGRRRSTTGLADRLGTAA
jgi:glycosyltransferase involved in cell wall biosynthesis